MHLYISQIQHPTDLEWGNGDEKGIHFQSCTALGRHTMGAGCYWETGSGQIIPTRKHHDGFVSGPAALPEPQRTAPTGKGDNRSRSQGRRLPAARPAILSWDRNHAEYGRPGIPGLLPEPAESELSPNMGRLSKCGLTRVPTAVENTVCEGAWETENQGCLL